MPCIGRHVALLDRTRVSVRLYCGTYTLKEISSIHHDCNNSCMIGGRTTGEQKLNGIKKTKATLARVMGYVEQSDIHTPALTVIESLTFSAHLRLPRNVNKRSEAKFVDNVRPLLLPCIAIVSKARLVLRSQKRHNKQKKTLDWPIFGSHTTHAGLQLW